MTSDLVLGTRYASQIKGGVEPVAVLPGVSSSPMFVQQGSTQSLLQPIVMVQSDCAGGCKGCPPAVSLRQFTKACTHVGSKSQSTSKMTYGFHSPDIVHGILIVVRNPFQIVRTRSNIEIIQRTRKNKEAVKAGENYLNTRETLLEWCSMADKSFDGRRVSLDTTRRSSDSWVMAAAKMCPASSQSSIVTTREDELNDHFPIDLDVIEKYSNIPCYSEFIRYVQFYNYAALLSNSYIKKEVLRIEDLADLEHGDQFLRILGKLVTDFFRRPIRNAPSTHFQRQRVAPTDLVQDKLSLFTDSEVLRLEEMTRTLASDYVWDIISSYFGYVGERNQSNNSLLLIDS